ncbi:glycerophosphodiester phosphodiesterase GDPDL4-like [Tasmannia lanceolata]|uniref:glycerophosphodiester phosphodiesterase GDPDL4-like n=1 Tax=Tasmannia lanceolata TaxID=3420 RepID=UPI004064768A
MPTFRFLLLLLFFLHSSLVASQRSRNSTSSWQTLSGNAPLVIARGGFSGLFPDSSLPAYQFALATSLTTVILWCDVQLTKDSFGICAPPNVELDNSTNIAIVFPNNKKTYIVNGVPMDGWFSLDYNLKDLSNVYLVQGIYSRSNLFDGNPFNLNTVEQVAQLKPPGLWLNIQHDMFYRQHNLSMRSFVLTVSKRVIITYVSSPEVAFLSSISARFKGSSTKLVFRFLGADVTEPSTNQTYGSLLRNLTFIKTFASGVLVPKNYIWPVNSAMYLQPHTSVVLDAHKEGLDIFAADFINDAAPLSYNYSYDPIAEYLSYIDNGDFSVDGVLSDFPITPSQTIGCFHHINKNGSGNEKPVIISHDGASGIYPGCTDLSYQKAVDDGADIIDCSVQLTEDGIPICLGSIDLIASTTVVQTPYSSLLANIPEIQGTAGIFTFNLNWSDIHSRLKPAISNPFLSKYFIRTNPLYANAGHFMSLSDFLTFAKGKPITGILINIENAAYLAQKQGMSIVDTVISTLNASGYTNQTSLEVTIQSTNSSVLTKFRQQTHYKLMYKIDETVRDALNSSINDIKKFADSVAIGKDSIFPQNDDQFITGATDLVQKLKSFNLSVYAHLFMNEFVSQAWDFFSDPTVEINSFFQGAGVDGIITDFPGTARSYRSNTCLKLGSNMPTYMLPVQPGGLIQLLYAIPPATAPFPSLTASDVIEPPLPPVSERANSTGGSVLGPTSNVTPQTPPSGTSPSGQPHTTACTFISLAMLLVSLLLLPM